ncbi:MAG: hybrid sensor histidine kinase/response regulator [Bacteroidota bacterium]|nr:hybrid sensor histidine kinase/response regulator [Bacteroidota bacterium]MDX5429769.1 hybrid sensor histidine kinase/response regulator [Bacteroidota bacterium]MDX5468548.1 hybrid sensor histidine kinase/response regulator [Bacteroidota bacterium]
MSKDRVRVLYIDDEENNLKAFKASFRRDFEIYTVTDAYEAYRLLDEVDIHVALADQRMPKVSGVEFFEKIAEKHPDVIRILITAYTNSQTIIDAVNKGKIDQYVVKPWDPTNLKSIIESSYDVHLAKKELKIKNEELSKANDELNRFVYSASHDLRAPLMSILGLVELSRLEKGAGDPYVYLDMIEKSVQKLDTFIQNIIEYYQNARAESNYERILFEPLVQEVVETLKNTDPHVKFTLDIQQSEDFYSDEFRIHVILNNLVSNAIKYQKGDNTTPEVHITVKSDNQRALVLIKDNGVGILQEHLESIFKMFFRTKTQNRAPGTGIGLYIVKEALSKIGGEIKVNSVYGEGTTFELVLPNLERA